MEALETGAELKEFRGTKAEKMFTLLATPGLQAERYNELMPWRLKYVVEYEKAYRFGFVRKGFYSVDIIEAKPKN